MCVSLCVCGGGGGLFMEGGGWSSEKQHSRPTLITVCVCVCLRERACVRVHMTQCVCVRACVRARAYVRSARTYSPAGSSRQTTVLQLPRTNGQNDRPYN